MRLRLPLLLINFKTYDRALAKAAVKLAREIKRPHVAAAVSPCMLANVAKILPTFAQHIDPLEPGRHTGAVLAAEVKALGAIGTLINHAEKRLQLTDISTCVELCRKYRLKSVVCVHDDMEARAAARFRPNFIALEPPELIAGKISVAHAKPEMLRAAAKHVKAISKRTVLLCGAGIRSADDVKKALELGMRGVLVASAVIRAKRPARAIERLLAGLEI